MEDELIFSKEWFMLEKYHFKILAVITELADNTGTFVKICLYKTHPATRTK